MKSNNNEHENIIIKCFYNYQWDPKLLFPEKFIDVTTREKFMIIFKSITFNEFRERFLKAIYNKEMCWEEFNFM